MQSWIIDVLRQKERDTENYIWMFKIIKYFIRVMRKTDIQCS